jgi:hypothetical protein
MDFTGGLPRREPVYCVVWRFRVTAARIATTRSVRAGIQPFDFILETKATPFVHPKDDKKHEIVAIEME